MEHIDLTHMGRVLALTPNDEVNTLISVQMSHEFGRRNVFQISGDSVPKKGAKSASNDAGELRGRQLFSDSVDYFHMSRRLAANGRITVTTLSDKFTLADFQALHGPEAVLLFAVSPAGKLLVNSADSAFKAERESRIIAMVPPEARREAAQPQPAAPTTPLAGPNATDA